MKIVGQENDIDKTENQEELGTARGEIRKPKLKRN